MHTFILPFYPSDVPSVVSGNQLLILDPQEDYFKTHKGTTTTYSWKLPKKWTKLKRYADQVSPYIGLFGCTEEIFSTGKYQGTLFRFPLRDTASRLSNEVFTSKDSILHLFRSFMKDATETCLFLKNIENIELFHREKGKVSQTQLFSVKVNEDCLQEVKQQRTTLIRKLEEKHTNPSDLIGEVSISYLAKIKEEKDTATSLSKHYVVNQYYNDKDASKDLRNYLADENMSVLPIVGSAMFVEQSPHNKTDNTPRGREFCFLPLPAEETSSTGLPIHVNGYFMLTQDRSHLKWNPKDENAQMSWNETLLEELLPKSYCEMLSHAIRENKGDITSVSVGDIYHAIPDVSHVSEKWSSIVNKILIEILKLPCLHSPRRGGEWLTINDSLVSPTCKDEKTQECLNKLLLDNDFPLVFPPHHLLKGMQQVEYVPRAAGAADIIHILKNSNKYKEYTDDIKLTLLKYLLYEADIKDIEGLALLPTENGKFIEFSAGGSKLHLLPDGLPHTIFPVRKEEFVKHNLEPPILKKLMIIAASEMSRLTV